MDFNLEESSLKYNNEVILTNFSDNISIYEQDVISTNGIFLKFSKTQPFASAYWNEIKIDSLKRFTALYRADPYWYLPYFGIEQKKIPKRSIIVLYKRIDGLNVILVPLIYKGYNIYLNGRDDGLEVMADNNCNSGHIKMIVGLYVGIGEDPYKLLEEAAKAVSNFINVGKLREEKGLPEWMDSLGYCTWYTFYHKINQENVIRMLENIVNKNGVKLGFFLLDDGWQISKYRTLVDKGVNKKKFPDGLKNFVELIKKKFRIKSFIIWHTIQGYWFGINLRGAYSKKFKKQLIKNRAYWGISNPSMGTSSNLIAKSFTNLTRFLFIKAGILLPKDMIMFWEDFHGWLASQNVDGVKVDNQSGTELQCYDLSYQANLMRKYHKVLEDSVSKHFSKYSIINCMSQNTNVYYQLINSNITRNSQDYFPKSENKQTQHVIMNAYNNLWCGQFSFPDWDMFQSDHPWGAYQAASRAISGSPIYFADDFGKIDTNILSKIALPDGKLLRCEDIALPCRDILFLNPAQPNRALKMFNHNKFNSVLGIFNAMVNTDIKTTYSPSDIEGVNPKEEYAVFGTESGLLKKLKYSDSLEIKLKPKEFEIFTISPINHGFAPIGMIDKYNPGGIFEEINYNSEEISMDVKFGGNLGFYCEKKPKKIHVNNNEIEFEFIKEQKFLKMKTHSSESQKIESHFKLKILEYYQ